MRVDTGERERWEQYSASAWNFHAPPILQSLTAWPQWAPPSLSPELSLVVQWHFHSRQVGDSDSLPVFPCKQKFNAFCNNFPDVATSPVNWICSLDILYFLPELSLPLFCFSKATLLNAFIILDLFGCSSTVLFVVCLLFLEYSLYLSYKSNIKIMLLILIHFGV